MARATLACVPLAGLGAGLLVLAGGLLVVALLGPVEGGCGGSPAGPAAGLVMGPPGPGSLAGATEYGGSGDPSSGVLGASGANLLAHPDSYAELGGASFTTAQI